MNTATDKSMRLTAFPSGWYAVACSAELKRGDVLRRKLMDRELVVYRTASGKVQIKDAHCPHMGAHLGVGGKVVGESIRCPFHGFTFSADGRCTSTPYGKQIPKLCMSGWRSREIHGVILCYYHPQIRKPVWEIKPILAEQKRLQWSQPVVRRWQIRTHPAEIIENTVDIGHFASVHHYKSVDVTQAMQCDGPHLTMGYVATRERGLLGRHDPKKLQMQLDINASGVGYSRVEVSDKSLGMRVRLVVMPTPIDDENVAVYVTTQVALLPMLTGKVAWLNRCIPRNLLAKIIARLAAREMGCDFKRDIDIWQNKRYCHPPRLANGDGPIMAYRKWTTQFYEQSKVDQLIPLQVVS